MGNNITIFATSVFAFTKAVYRRLSAKYSPFRRSLHINVREWPVEEWAMRRSFLGAKESCRRFANNQFRMFRCHGIVISGLRFATFSIVVAHCGTAVAESLAHTKVLATPAMPRPGYLQQAIDPAFGTIITRITDPGHALAPGIICNTAYCRHRYSSTQAWNADQSLLVITNGCNGMCFLDGHTYVPIFYRNVPDDCKWHPKDPELMICVVPRKVYSWAPRTNTTTVLYAPADYTELEFGPYKGNVSADGSRLVLRAKNSSGSLVAFAYNLATKTKFPDIAAGALPGSNRSCGISPSGRYIACFQALPDGTEPAYIFTFEGAEVQHWTEHHRPAHGDMAIDDDGADVYVGISKADPDKWHVIKRRLEDGIVTDLTPAGYATHASVRNIGRPGWVFLSYEGSYSQVLENTGWAPFYQEVIALRMDGSGELKRIAQTHNAKVDYNGETHASPSPDGSQVIWSSNWGQSGGPVADYVARLSIPLQLQSH